MFIVEIDGEANALISSVILFLLFGLLLFRYFKWHKADFFSHFPSIYSQCYFITSSSADRLGHIT